MRAISIFLIVLGIIGLAYGGIVYTKRDKVVDAGPFQASIDREQRIPLPPAAGAVALIAGLILLTRRTRTSW